MWPLGCSQGQNLKGGRETPSGQQRLQAKGMSVLSHAAWAGSFLKKASPRNSPLHKLRQSARIGSKAPLWHFLSLPPAPGAPALPLEGSKFASGFSRHGTAPLTSLVTEESLPARAGEIGHRRHHGLSARRCLERHLTLDGLGSTAGL